MAANPKDRVDVYTRVTDQIIRAIEAGAGDWTMPWHAGEHRFQLPVNAATGKRYRGVNVVALWAEAHFHDYPEAVWATFKQWSDLGHRVKKGEHAAIGVLWKPIGVTDEGKADNADAEDEPERRWMSRAFSLFNAAQVEGYEPPKQPVLPTQQRIAHAEAFFAGLGADVRHGGNRAFYQPANDYIQMPPFESFADPIAYYATLGHEATHWTGAAKRLARDLTGRFGSEAYAAEELIAELGAAFIAADLELTSEPRADHAAYIDNWLKILKADNRAIFTAASHAQRAADYLHVQFEQSPHPHTEGAQKISIGSLTPRSSMSRLRNLSIA